MLKLFTEYRYLLWQFTKRQIEQRHKGSFLGIAWSILQPLCMMAIYTTVFGLIFRGKYAGVEDHSTIDYALGVFFSLTIFQTLADVINCSPTTISNQPNLVKKVVFPLEILPFSNSAMAFYQFGISLVLTIFGVATLGQGIDLHSIFFIFALLPLIPMCLGIALLFSSLGVFLRDLQQIANPLSMLFMYGSAVFYSAEMVPEKLWVFLKFNPVLHIIEQARATLLWHQPIDWVWIGYSFILGFIILFIGLASFKKLSPAFADVM